MGALASSTRRRVWARRRGGIAFGLVWALVAGACGEQSRVDPNAPVTVAGAVRAPDGAPLADRPVRLGGGVGTGEGLFAALTLGLACTTGVCSGKVFDATTAADGTYRFDVQGRETQSSFGEALSQLVSVSAAPRGGQVSGAAVSARFRIQVPDVRLPPLDLVDPGLLVEGPGDVVARWSTPRPGPYELTFEKAETVPIWQVTTADGTASVDPRVLEDTSGRVVVAGGSTDRIEGSSLEVHWRSPGVGYAAGAGPPPSRGRSCRFVDGSGAARPSEANCQVTDGDLTAVGTASSACRPPASTTLAGAPSTRPPGCPRPVGVIVDLGKPVPAELVVVRGCEGGCTVEVSVDGATYRPVGAASEGFGTVLLDRQPVTSVRVGLGSGSGLREVSVWGPRPVRAALRSVNEDSGRLRDVFGGGRKDGEGDVPVALSLIAAALLGAALAGVAFAAAHRRHGYGALLAKGGIAPGPGRELNDVLAMIDADLPPGRGASVSAALAAIRADER